MRIVAKDLLPGKTYHLQFRSKNAGEVSEWGHSHEVTIGTTTSKPLAPTGVTLESVSDSFHAKWNRVTHSEDGLLATDLAGYVVRFRNVVNNQTATFETSDTSFELTFNLNFAMFTPIAGQIGVTIAAKNNMGVQGDWSEEVITQNPPPGPVRNLVAEGIMDGIAATWEPPENLEDDFKEYRAYVGTSEAFSPTNPVWTGVGTSAVYYTSTKVNHWVKVIAYDKFNGASTVVTAGPVMPKSSVEVDVDAPDTPTNLNGTISGQRLTATWTAPANPDSDLAGYQIGYRPVGATGWSYATASHEDTSVVIEPITRYTNYDIKIQAHDFSFNYSPWSANSTVIGETNTPPATPTGVQVKGAITSAMVLWNANTDIDLAGYEVQFKASSAPVDVDPVFPTTARTMSFSEDVSQDTTYYARVRAVDNQGLKSAWSAAVSGVVGFVPPVELSDGEVPSSSPTAVLSEGVGAIYARWNPVANDDPVTYEVHLGTTTGFTAGSTTKIGDTSSTFATIQKLPNGSPLIVGTTYYVKLIAKDVDGPGPVGAVSNGVAIEYVPTQEDIDGLDSRLDDTITDTTVQYAVSASETVAPIGGWSADTPTRTPGSYIWFRTVLTYSDGSGATSNPALLTGNTGAQGGQGIPGTPGADGTSLYTWIKFADTPTTGISDTPDGKTYMGIAYNKPSATETDNYADYSWSLIKGADGTDGKGISTTVVNYAKSTNGTTAPTTGWGTEIPTTVAGEYLWTRTETTYTDASKSTAYSVARHGATGGAGAAGRGITGTTVTYQKSNSGTVQPTTWLSSIPVTAPGEFLWTKTTTTYTSAPLSIDSFSVAKHGETGQQGLPGTPGADGQPTYTWIRYAPNGNPSDAQVTNTPQANTTHIGLAYNKPTETESSVATDYTWSLIQGPKGDDGDAGKGISSTTVTYQTHSNGTTAPTGTWASTPTATSPGQFLWTRTITTFTDGTTNAASPAYSVAAHGSTGGTGAPGRGVTGTVVNYAVSSSGTVEPTTGWGTAIPATSPGQFLWTRTVTSYSSAPLTVDSYSVAKHGSTGAPGSDGISVNSVTPFYRTVTKGAGAPTQPSGNGDPSGWSKTEPAFVMGTELYRTERISYSNSTSAWTPVTKVASYSGIDAVNTIAITADKRVRKSTVAPTASDAVGAPEGALWYVYGAATEPGTGTVLKQTYELVGSTWQPRGIDRTFIPAIDIGDGTFGTLAGGRLVANSVKAAQIDTADLTANSAFINTLKVNAANVQGTLTIGQLPGSVAETGDITAAVNPINNTINGWIAGTGTTMINGGIIQTDSIGALQIKTEEIAADQAFLNNLTVTNGNISSLDANKLTAGTGLIANLTVKSILTLGDASTNGVIQSYGFSGTTAGFKIDKSGVVINQGSIEARALKIQYGQNLLPVAYADFESNPAWYSTNISSPNSFVFSVKTGGKFNKQYLEVRKTSAVNAALHMSPSINQYVIPVDENKQYILSVWVRGGPVSSMFRLQPRWNNDAYGPQHEVMIAANSDWQRVSSVVTVPAGITACNFIVHSSTSVVDAGWDIDGLQFEEKIGGLDTPSAWTPPSMTTVDGGMIRTGEIRSNQNIDVNGVQQPMWSINMAGGMQIGSAVIRGNLTVGATSDATGSVIQSSNYVAGVSGFVMRGSDGFAEFQNLLVNLNSTTPGQIIVGTLDQGGQTIITGGAGGGVKFFIPEAEAAVAEFGRNVLARNAEGATVASMGDDGVVSGQTGIFENLTVAGMDVTERVTRDDSTVVVLDDTGAVGTGYGPYTIETGFREVGFFAEPNRLYKIENWVHIFNTSTAAGTYFAYLRYTSSPDPTSSAPAPLVSSSELSSNDGPVTNSAEGRFFNTGYLFANSSGQNVRLLITARGGGGRAHRFVRSRFAVTDLGIYAPLVTSGRFSLGGSSGAPTPDPTSPPQLYKKWYDFNWEEVYQTSGPAAHGSGGLGSKARMGRAGANSNFPWGTMLGLPSQLVSDLSGATIKKAGIRITSLSWKDGAVISGYATASSPPANMPTTPSGTANIGTLPKSATKTLWLPSSYYTTLKTSGRALTLGRLNASGYNDTFIEFANISAASQVRPRLYVEYEK